MQGTLLKEKTLYSEYMPLVKSSDNTIFAYEALMRSKTGHNPEMLFEYARQQNVLYTLDTTGILNAVQQYPTYYLNQYYLFLNIFPSTITHPKFEAFLVDVIRLYPHIIGKIVFELNETPVEESLWGQPLFLKRLTFIKDLGFFVAFDDVQLTKASLHRIEILNPDFVKLDHTKANNLSTSIEKRQLISLFLEFTTNSMSLVLEGIETQPDYQTAKELGVPILQGYYIAKPQTLE